ncbi:carboxymuconolactone decarboxylase family protein [Burkholderia sp. SCN-KJ]|uniref:carboxymuconolactone decarboxylase family protein n=1 Tax=Burkholderia sp. SCN-KJ TaxID=2969248 RepID=UPI00214FB1B2|nr:carboxymuconolactone decarboxylase family protein [Burkholderia sp. SCN-KJ]MCR4470029.1 carboxymuconolactone decarboxylase family protein [Burkholderia sp. SCN-KJ]
MGRITIPAIESATGATADIYAKVKKIAGGRVPNTYAALGYLVPVPLAAVLDVQRTLASGSLSQRDLQTIKLLVSAKTGCDVCVAAHSYVGKMAGLSVDALRAIRTGQATGDAKRDALVRFVSHLQATSGTISQDEFAAIRAAGYSDTQLAEISLTIALSIFTNTFNRINGTDVDFPPVE